MSDFRSVWGDVCVSVNKVECHIWPWGGCCLQGLNFSGADLSRLDLRYINFKLANLSRCNLTHANLCCSNLERADLSGANLDVSLKSIVHEVFWKESIPNEEHCRTWTCPTSVLPLSFGVIFHCCSHMYNTNIKENVFTCWHVGLVSGRGQTYKVWRCCVPTLRALLSRAVTLRIHLAWRPTWKVFYHPPPSQSSHTLSTVFFKQMLFSGANLKGVDMEGSQMTGINLRVATLKNAKLKNCNLRGATLAGTDLEVIEEEGTICKVSAIQTHLRELCFRCVFRHVQLADVPSQFNVWIANQPAKTKRFNSWNDVFCFIC